MRECFTYVCYLQRVFFLILTSADDKAFFFSNDYVWSQNSLIINECTEKDSQMYFVIYL